MSAAKLDFYSKPSHGIPFPFLQPHFAGLYPQPGYAVGLGRKQSSRFEIAKHSEGNCMIITLTNFNGNEVAGWECTLFALAVKAALEYLH